MRSGGKIIDLLARRLTAMPSERLEQLLDKRGTTGGMINIKRSCGIILARGGSNAFRGRT